MLPAQTIDFTRGDIGWWLFFVTIPLIFIGKNLKAEKRKTFGSLFRNWLLGSGVALVICGLLAGWQSFGPQNFVRMQISDENVVLGFRWPNSDRVISIKS